MALIDTLSKKQIDLLLEKLAPGKEVDNVKEFLGAFDDEDIKQLLISLGDAETFASPGGETGSLLPKIEIKKSRTKKEKAPKAESAEEKKGAKAKESPEPVEEPVQVKADSTMIVPGSVPSETESATDSGLTLKVVPPRGFNYNDYIPNPERDSDLRGFIPRPEYFSAIEMFYRARQNLLLIGEAGAGKSTIGKHFAHKNGFPYLAISADGLMGIKELFGLASISEATSYFVEGLFTTFTQIGWKTIEVVNKDTGKKEYKMVDDETQPGAVILIDEVTALDPSKNFIFHQILAERKFFVRDANKTYYVAPRVMIMFAGNPKDPRYPGVGKMNLAFADRMGTVILQPLGIDKIKEVLKRDYEGLLSKDDIEFIILYIAKMRDFIKSGEEPIPAELSLRSIRRIADFMAKGASKRTAVELGFLNTYIAHDKDTYDTLSGHSASLV